MFSGDKCEYSGMQPVTRTSLEDTQSENSADSPLSLEADLTACTAERMLST